jgi:hypothetical protein
MRVLNTSGRVTIRVLTLGSTRIGDLQTPVLQTAAGARTATVVRTATGVIGTGAIAGAEVTTGAATGASQTVQ